MRSRVFADVATSRSYRDAFLTGQSDHWDEQQLHTRTYRRLAMDDVVTPKFFDVRNKGGIICSPMYKEDLLVECDATVFELEGYHKQPYYHATRIKPVFDLLDTSAVRKLHPDHIAMDELFKQFSRETDLAVMRAHADVDISEMQLLASLGELPETLSWLASLVKRVKDLVSAFKRKREVTNVLRKLWYDATEDIHISGNKLTMAKFERYVKLLVRRNERKKLSKKDSSLVDAFGNAWLELRYAVRPLIGDIQNAINALGATIDKQRCVARGHEYATSKREEVVSNSDPYYRVTARITEEESVRARGGVLYAIEQQVVSWIAIFGLDQPLESLWALVPFSFIIDWVFSIGDWLQSVFKSAGLDILTSWVSLIVERKRQVKVINTHYYVDEPNWHHELKSSEFGSSLWKATWKWRYPQPDVPTLPRLDLKMNLAKILDLGMIGRALTSDMSSEVTKRSIRHA